MVVVEKYQFESLDLNIDSILAFSAGHESAAEKKHTLRAQCSACGRTSKKNAETVPSPFKQNHGTVLT